MPDSSDLIQQVAQGIQASRTTSPTPPGQTDKPDKSPTGDYIEAINQVFALFRLNYHNQYYAAFPDAEQLKQIKKLWLESLAHYPVEQILRGAKHAIEHSEYLPTLNRMHDCCRQGLQEYGLPSEHDAYMEACQAALPKSAQPWSHPAVYLAGRDTNWFFLANNIERDTWPLFKQHYQHYCNLALRGDTLEIPEPEALDKPHSEPLTKEQQRAELKKLRDQVDL